MDLISFDCQMQIFFSNWIILNAVLVAVNKHVLLQQFLPLFMLAHSRKESINQSINIDINRPIGQSIIIYVPLIIANFYDFMPKWPNFNWILDRAY